MKIHTLAFATLLWVAASATAQEYYPLQFEFRDYDRQPWVADFEVRFEAEGDTQVIEISAADLAPADGLTGYFSERLSLPDGRRIRLTVRLAGTNIQGSAYFRTRADEPVGIRVVLQADEAEVEARSESEAREATSSSSAWTLQGELGVGSVLYKLVRVTAGGRAENHSRATRESQSRTTNSRSVRYTVRYPKPELSVSVE